MSDGPVWGMGWGPLSGLETPGCDVLLGAQGGVASAPRHPRGETRLRCCSRGASAWPRAGGALPLGALVPGRFPVNLLPAGRRRWGPPGEPRSVQVAFASQFEGPPASWLSPQMPGPPGSCGTAWPAPSGQGWGGPDPWGAGHGRRGMLGRCGALPGPRLEGAPPPGM